MLLLGSIWSMAAVAEGGEENTARSRPFGSFTNQPWNNREQSRIKLQQAHADCNLGQQGTHRQALRLVRCPPRFWVGKS